MVSEADEMRLLFWNMHRKDLSEALAGILNDAEYTLVILCEFGGQKGKLLSTVNRQGAFYSWCEGSDGRMTALTRLKSGEVTRIRDEGLVDDDDARYSFWRLTCSKEPITVCGLHLPAGPHHSLKAKNQLLIRLSRDIGVVEKQEGHERTILLGDFNLNPFDDMVVSSEGLHAVSSLSEAKRLRSRTVQREERALFYNPMWSHLGDRPTEPAGTYYWPQSVDQYGWQMYDQVLFRPSMMDVFSDFEVDIVTGSAENPLTDKYGHPDKVRLSDHLPIRVHFLDRAST
jgi:exonuclease III